MWETIQLVFPLITCVLGILFGMRIETRGISGIQQDVMNVINQIKTDVADVKAKLNPPQPTPAA